ncbi:MAG: SDR family oxidoreductase [Verrucomicrobiota bacterium]|nr:SDR family oxidoreductase [Verrucomicrobiota bacterium]
MKTVLITGASSGLGLALAKRFAAEQWQVFGTYRTAFDSKGLEKVTWFYLDLEQQDSPRNLFSDISSKISRLDALINNAGIATDHLVAGLPVDEWDRTMTVNLKGAYLCAQAALPLFSNGGHILNIGSYAGFQGPAGQSSYAASKAALHGLTLSLASELAGRNIRVNTLCPGFLLTKMTASLSDAQRTRLIQMNLLGRSNSLEEVARFGAFLATTENISGQLFSLDSRVLP